MPTENRSSTIEQHDHIEGIIDMVSVPRQVIEFAAGLKWHGYKSGTDQKDDQLQSLNKLRTILAAPAPQPHPEPIAWMVGTAIWWTKEEAERDAAATGLPIIAVGPITDTASPPVECSHEWTDDGEFMLVCTACGTQENHDPKWRDMASAPRDGTLVRLLVEFTEHATEDSESMPSPTIGANSYDHTGEDVWQFAGWSWEQDCFTQGAGDPIGWLPLLDTPHTDPCEVERLRSVIEQQKNLIASLRAELVESRSIDASAEPSAAAESIPEGYSLMPRRLTAENGAKALLLGEFKLEVTRECPECLELDDPAEGCEICDGEGEFAQRHTIPWDQIKFIYSEAVKGLALEPEVAR